jgi:hypothetical protein
MNSIIPIIKELERIYDFIAKKQGLKHERPIITIQTKGRRKQTLGWYWDKKWQSDKKEVGEINICAEELKKHPVETLIHEMVHYSNACDKILDCNDAGYHNKSFNIKAEEYGLNVEKDGRNGWGHTTVSENLQKILKTANIDDKIFSLYRKTSPSLTAPTKMKKYRCGCTTVRCATELKAKCLICNKEFLQEE